MVSDTRDKRVLAAELSCSSCGGIFTPARNRLLLKGLSCPYCGKAQSLLELTGLEDLEMAGGKAEAGPPRFQLGKEAEARPRTKGAVFGILYALGLMFLLGGLFLDVGDGGLGPPSWLESVHVLSVAGLYLLAYVVLFLPDAWVSLLFTRRPLLCIQGDELRCRSRSGRLKLALAQIHLVDAMPSHALETSLRELLFDGSEYSRILGKATHPHCLVLHLDNGLALVLPLLLEEALAKDMAARLNRYLAAREDGGDTGPEPETPWKDLPSPKLHPRRRAAFLSQGVKLPGEEVAPLVFCPHCGAKAQLPQQVQMGDAVTCSYCDGLVALRRLDDARLMDRFHLLCRAHMERRGAALQFQQPRLIYRFMSGPKSAGAYALWSSVALVCGALPVAPLIRHPVYLWLPVLLANLLPMLYLMRSTQVRGQRKDGLLLASKILAVLGSAALWLPAVVLYRLLGRVNPYTFHLDGRCLQEGFRFGRKREIPQGELKRAVLFMWDRLEAVDDPENYVERVTALWRESGKSDWLKSIYEGETLNLRAVWGLALEMTDGSVYLSQFLGDRPTAEILVLHINRSL